MFGQVSTAQFELSFDGEAVRDGSMDVHELAPALLAAGDLVREANRVLNGRRASVSVRVESEFQKSSFDISLLLDQNLIEQAKSLLAGKDKVLDAADLLKAIFGVGTVAGSIAGLVKVLKMLKGEPPSNVTVVDNRTTIIQTGSGQVVNNVDEATAKLYDNESTRKAAKRLLRPLSKPGIDAFEIRQDGQLVEKFTEEEAMPILQQDRPDMTIESAAASVMSRRDTVLRLASVSFIRGNKYKVTEGDTAFYVSIEDQKFLDDVENDRVSFSAHGRLWGGLRQEIIPGETKDVVEHTIEEVYKYEPYATPQQIELPELNQEDSSSSTDQT